MVSVPSCRPSATLLLSLLLPPIYIVAPDGLAAFDAITGSLEAAFYSEAQARSWAADRIAHGCVVVFSAEEDN